MSACVSTFPPSTRLITNILTTRTREHPDMLLRFPHSLLPMGPCISTLLQLTMSSSGGLGASLSLTTTGRGRWRHWRLTWCLTNTGISRVSTTLLDTTAHGSYTTGLCWKHWTLENPGECLCLGEMKCGCSAWSQSNLWTLKWRMKRNFKRLLPVEVTSYKIQNNNIFTFIFYLIKIF